MGRNERMVKNGLIVSHCQPRSTGVTKLAGHGPPFSFGSQPSGPLQFIVTRTCVSFISCRSAAAQTDAGYPTPRFAQLITQYSSH